MLLQRWRDDEHAHAAWQIREGMYSKHGQDPITPGLFKQIADAIRAAVPLDAVPTLAELLASEPPETWDP